MITIPLHKEHFTKQKQLIAHSNNFEVNAFVFNSGIEALEIKNNQGHLIVLPFLGQIIWDAKFLGIDMCMKNMFSEPKKSNGIIGTYGCFAFHSGLISNGCPSPEDNHLLHGEMPCAPMDSAWLEIEMGCLTVKGQYEYVMGFGEHYLATPSISLEANASLFDIKMKVKNLGSKPMPLQYMCHMNTAYVEGATFEQNIPDEAIKLRETIPGHVKPTEQWLDYNEMLKVSPPIQSLTDNKMYDPEIVYFMDKLSKFTDEAIFEMTISKDNKLITHFDTSMFYYATRWILYNGDQTVGAYVLPATCRPEGFLAAQLNDTLLYLATNEEREFKVRTGISKR